MICHEAPCKAIIYSNYEDQEKVLEEELESTTGLGRTWRDNDPVDARLMISLVRSSPKDNDFTVVAEVDSE